MLAVSAAYYQHEFLWEHLRTIPRRWLDRQEHFYGMNPYPHVEKKQVIHRAFTREKDLAPQWT